MYGKMKGETTSAFIHFLSDFYKDKLHQDWFSSKTVIVKNQNMKNKVMKTWL